MATRDIPFEHMPRVDIAALHAEDFYNDEIKDHPWRFGKNIYVNYNFNNSGRWYNLGDGSRIWQLGISSKGAVSLNLAFNRYKLPKGSKLYIFTSDGKEILGAFTNQNNQEDGFFATSLLRGDSIIIEYYEPAKPSFIPELNLWRVTHGYRGVKEFSKSFGSSGPCNVNTACPEAETVRDQIRSVALLVSGGNGYCTGALINNVNNDGTPYFLSADHCYEQPGTLVFWFNWESETCDDPDESPEANTLSGAINRARGSDSDFWLMELNQIPPKEFGVFYAGWNRSIPYSMDGRVYGIHHPSGDIKKISWSDSVLVASALGEPPGTGSDYWRIESWSDGTTTERGSSGSPLFDSTGKIIGQLFGGDAACGNTESDWYGRFGISWTGGGTNATRLSNWLDPNNSGLITIDGFDPEVGQYQIDGQMASILEPFENYTDSGAIIPRVLIRNAGSEQLTDAIIRLYIDTSYSDSVTWTGILNMGEKETVELSEINLGYDVFDIMAKIEVIDDENPVNDSLLRITTVLNCGGDTLPYEEGFDRDKALLCWEIITVASENGKIERVAFGEKPFCEASNGTHLIQFNSYDCSSGSEVRLQSKSFSTLIMDSIVVAFDWHHDQGYSPRADRVIVQYSVDGTSWVDVKAINRYHNTINGWSRKEILLPGEAADQEEVYFGFLFHSEYGNNCHLDSIVITATPFEEPYPQFSAQPRVVVMDSIIVFTDESLNEPTSWEWDFGEGATPASDTGQGPHEVIYSSIGLKTISLLVEGQFLRTKTDYVLVEPSPFIVPRYLTATVEENDVHLKWEMTHSLLKEYGWDSNALSSIAKATLVNFTIYRNEIAIDTVLEHSYIDTSLYPGIYTYYVVANYKAPEGISDPSNQVLADVPVSTISVKGEADIRIFPNPTTGKLFIESNKQFTLVIYNSQGAVVDEFVIDRENRSIDLSKHPPGVYVLRFSNDENIQINKIILK